MRQIRIQHTQIMQKTGGRKYIDLNAEQSSMFHIST